MTKCCTEIFRPEFLHESEEHETMLDGSVAYSLRNTKRSRGAKSAPKTKFAASGRCMRDSVAMLIISLYVAVTIWHLPTATPAPSRQATFTADRFESVISYRNNTTESTPTANGDFVSFFLFQEARSAMNVSSTNGTHSELLLSLVRPLWLISGASYPWDFYLSESEEVYALAPSNRPDDILNQFNGSFHMVLLRSSADRSVTAELVKVEQENSEHMRISSNLLHYSPKPFPDIPLIVLCVSLVVSGILIAANWKRSLTVDLVFFLVAGTTAGFRMFMNLSDPVGSYASELHNENSTPITIVHLESIIMWLVWHITISRIELWTLLLVVVRIFAGFDLRFLHLIFVFALVFFFVALIGWLGLGDLISALSTFETTLMCQLGMISSNYPSDLQVESRIFLFTIWFLANACVVYCGLYNFYQAMLESGYSSRMWFGADWAVDSSEPSDFSDTVCTIQHAETDPPVFARMNRQLAVTDTFCTWLCISSAGKPRKPELSDADLVSAIESAFRTVSETLNDHPGNHE